MNIAITYSLCDRDVSALAMFREVYAGYMRMVGPSHELTINGAQNLVNALGKSGHFAEAKALLRKQIPNMRQLGPDHMSTISLRLLLAKCLYDNKNLKSTEGDVKEAVAILEDVDRRAKRVLGTQHPLAKDARGSLERARRRLAKFQTK